MTNFATKIKDTESESAKLNGVKRKPNNIGADSMITHAPLFGFPIQRKADCACGGGCPSCQAQNSNLSISHPNDTSEIEADHIADKVMRMPESQSLSNQFQSESFSESITPIVQTKSEGSGAVNNDLGNKITSSKGSSLDGNTQAFMQSRFGSDFSDVKIHTDGEAVQMNRELNARAFTTGNDIYFNEGQYQPNSESGKHLLAHELTHVRQGGGTIRRCVNPKKNDPLYDALAKKIQDHAVYKALAPDDLTVADGIITEAKKKNDCLYLLGKLKLLFDTPVAAAGTVATATRAAVAVEHKKEQARIAKPAEAKKLKIEEDASAAAAGKLKPVKGKFGKGDTDSGTYYIDNSNLANIVVKAKIFLHKHDAGTDDDVMKIKDMQDGIEKAASTKGFLVDIDFVDVADSETFDVKVNPSTWTVADEWGSGGTPLAYAHEIFHLFAFELDRYNYIESHSANQDMKIPNRLYWFAQQLAKPAGFDDPRSIMASGSDPLDEDVCMVANVPNVADCVKERKKR